ncbi:hypothetical protein E2C01_026068 [Portunus trituberculatus]|uniref:Uncharacterized protein n=1 Tax=Portunus trituberculatus TaxID=210409 RepID=A0A5B7EES4_PORTR|nr:hypothetical protein [Portunus trituberculatus]
MKGSLGDLPVECGPQVVIIDGGDRAVLPHKHGGRNATDVVCPNLKLEKDRVRDGSMSFFDGIPEEEGDQCLRHWSGQTLNSKEQVPVSCS